MPPTERPDPTTSDTLPIWMAALVAGGCRVAGNGVVKTIDWRCISGHAVYTNHHAGAEIIQPFGIRVERGATLVVSWQPGETAYTVELHRTKSLAA